jgi:hypothetical protein
MLWYRTGAEPRYVRCPLSPSIGTERVCVQLREPVGDRVAVTYGLHASTEDGHTPVPPQIQVNVIHFRAQLRALLALPTTPSSPMAGCSASGCSTSTRSRGGPASARRLRDQVLQPGRALHHRPKPTRLDLRGRGRLAHRKSYLWRHRRTQGGLACLPRASCVDNDGASSPGRACSPPIYVWSRKWASLAAVRQASIRKPMTRRCWERHLRWRVYHTRGCVS